MEIQKADKERITIKEFAAKFKSKSEVYSWFVSN